MFVLMIMLLMVGLYISSTNQYLNVCLKREANILCVPETPTLQQEAKLFS